METKNQDQEKHRVLLAWTTPEFVPIPRGKTWYIVAGLIMATMILYGFLSGSITMGIVFILVSVLFMITEHKAPRDIDVVITDMGIQYDKIFYPFHHINSFFMVYHPPYVRTMYLRIRVGKGIKQIKIELDHMNPVILREVLIREIPEIEGADEPMVDILTRLLRLQ